MILRILSTPELNFSESWKIGWEKIMSFHKFDKIIFLFWLVGPFIYLIERGPADLWLSILVIIFLVRSFKQRTWSWISTLWFKVTLIFWSVCIISSLASTDPFYSFTEAFLWIRFPLYAIAAQKWFASDRDIRIMMFSLILIGLFILSSILLLEFFIDYKHRLTWPYGDVIPGTYISKFCLPVFCASIALLTYKLNRERIFLLLIIIFALVMVILCGDRTNFIILFCSAILSAIIWKPHKLTIIFFVSVITIPSLSIITINPNSKVRFVNNFILDKNHEIKDSGMWSAWRAGIQQGLYKPIIGVGPSMMRKKCSSLPPNEPKWLPGQNLCANHPHNFYIQLFAETGVLGLFFGSLMMLLIFLECFKTKLRSAVCPMVATAFIIPLALFFPIQQFGNFFGQWGNLFLWFAIGFAVSNSKNAKETKLLF